MLYKLKDFYLLIFYGGGFSGLHRNYIFIGKADFQNASIRIQNVMLELEGAFDHRTNDFKPKTTEC